MSTLRERRDVFWKAKAKVFAKQRDAEAHRRCEAEIKASDAIGCRKSLVKQLRIIRRFARAWKGIAKHLNVKDAAAQQRWEEIYQQKYDQIVELENILQGFKDQAHVCVDNNVAVTLFECPICVLKKRAGKLLKKRSKS